MHYLVSLIFFQRNKGDAGTRLSTACFLWFSIIGFLRYVANKSGGKANKPDHLVGAGALAV